MSYLQALAVGWSIYWRQALWTIAAAVLAVPLYFAARRGMPPLIVASAVLLFLAAVFPFVVARVLAIRYSDFRLVPVRRGVACGEIRFWEAAVLSALVNLVPAFGGPVLRFYLGAVPLLGPILLGLYPVLVGMPLAAWLLTAVPVGGLRIEVEDSTA